LTRFFNATVTAIFFEQLLFKIFNAQRLSSP